MPAFDDRVRPSDILREAARLMAFDGWDPARPVDTITPPRNGRFYRTGTLGQHIFRAYQVLRAGWYTMVRAKEALYRLLGLREGPRTIRVWERSAELTQSRVERTLLRAAYALDGAA